MEFRVKRESDAYVVTNIIPGFFAVFVSTSQVFFYFVFFFILFYFLFYFYFILFYFYFILFFFWFLFFNFYFYFFLFYFLLFTFFSFLFFPVTTATFSSDHSLIFFLLFFFSSFSNQVFLNIEKYFSVRVSISVWSLVLLSNLQSFPFSIIPRGEFVNYLEIFGLCNYILMITNFFELMIAQWFEV